MFKLLWAWATVSFSTHPECLKAPFTSIWSFETFTSSEFAQPMLQQLRGRFTQNHVITRQQITWTMCKQDTASTQCMCKQALSYFLSRRSIVSDWSLCLVGCFSPSVVTSPYLWPGARRFLTSCKKAKVTQSWRQSRIFDFHTQLHESESLVNSSIFVLYMQFC